MGTVGKAGEGIPRVGGGKFLHVVAKEIVSTDPQKITEGNNMANFGGTLGGFPCGDSLATDTNLLC